jgi:hypothetical protein
MFGKSFLGSIGIAPKAYVYPEEKFNDRNSSGTSTDYNIRDTGNAQTRLFDQSGFPIETPITRASTTRRDWEEFGPGLNFGGGGSVFVGGAKRKGSRKASKRRSRKRSRKSAKRT